jgi:hypothetical protein
MEKVVKVFTEEELQSLLQELSTEGIEPKVLWSGDGYTVTYKDQKILNEG